MRKRYASGSYCSDTVVVERSLHPPMEDAHCDEVKLTSQRDTTGERGGWDDKTGLTYDNIRY